MMSANIFFNCLFLTLMFFNNYGAEQISAPQGPQAAQTNTLAVGSPVIATKQNQASVQQNLTLNIQEPSTAPEDATIFLNFENASLASVVNYLGEQKKINIIPNKDLDAAKVTLTTRHPMTLDRAWNVLLTLLEMNNFTLVKIGNVYRVVPSANNGQEPLPIYSSNNGFDPESLPDSDLVIRYVYFLTNIKTDTAKTILSKMIDEKNILDNKDLNVIIIKDQCLNIKSAMSIVKALDVGGLRESIEVIKLTWANADNVANLFKDVLGTTDQDQRIIRFAIPQQKESTYFSSATTIKADPIKNTLILLGTQKNIDRIKSFIYKYIDVPIDDANSRLHIKELRYARAQDIKPIIDDLIKPRGVASDKSIVLEGGYKAFEDVIIQCETDDDNSASGKRGGGNRLIVACNRDDWARIDSFIDKIDKPQPQVAIEVLIIDVTIDQAKALGTQIFNLKGKPLGHNVNAQLQNLAATPLAFQRAQEGGTISTASLINLAAGGSKTANGSFLSLGRVNADPAQTNIWGIVSAVFNLNNSNIIDQPYLVANNNQKCSVTIKDTRRVGGEIDNKNNFNTVTPKVEITADIMVELTPTINLLGTVDLVINATINEFLESNNTDQPNRNNRLLNTKASMQAGEVLVLGGLTKSDLSETTNKTPILGDIPIIGSLFKRKDKTKKESNIYLFIRPSIIKPQFEGSPDEYTQLKLDYAKYQIMKNDTYVNDTDPIQRWFFKPTNQTIKNRLADAARGILRPIDNYTYGKNRPHAVNIKEDPYFSVSEAVDSAKRKAYALKMKPVATPQA